MKVLFLKSATLPLIISLAEIENGTITILDTVEDEEILRGKPSEMFFFGIDKLLQRNNLPYIALNALYIATGPGSYTGTRLAITIAKTLSILLPSLAIYKASLLDIYKEMSVSLPENVKKQHLSLVFARKNKYYVTYEIENEGSVSDTILPNMEIERLFEKCLYCNGQIFTENMLSFAHVPVEFNYDSWYKMSELVDDIHNFEPYYLEGVNIG